MGPINYSLDVASPFQAAAQGYQFGATVRNDQQQQLAQQAALKQQQQKQALLAELASKPDAGADDYARVITQIPELSEHLNRAWSVRNTAQQEAHASDLLQWGAAIKSGNPKVASEQMIQRADAMEATAGGPTQESKALRANARALEVSPQLALGQIQAMLAANPKGKEAADALASFGSEQRAGELQPGLVKKGAADADKAVADASTAQTTAKFADSKAVMDLKLSQEQIKKWAADTEIARQNARIAAMNAASTRESNELKRQELLMKRDDAIRDRDEKLRGKVADVESARSSIDNFVNTTDRFMALAVKRDSAGNPLKDKSGNFVPSDTLRAAAGPVDSRLPTVQTDVAELEELLETLKSQSFVGQIPLIKGTGNLSNAEGEKIEKAFVNLSLRQGPMSVLTNITEGQRLMLKGRKNIATKYGVPDNTPDTPAVDPSPNEVDALLKKYGGR